MMKGAIVVFCLLIITVGMQFPRKIGFPVLEAPYLGQKPPGDTSEIFAPGIVSTKDFDEYGCTFSPDGKEFYFSRRKGSYNVTILVTKQSDHGWTNPIEASFASGYNCVEPHYSASGNKIFFQSTAPLPQSWNLPYSKTRFKLWIAERVDEDWEKPYPLAEELSRGLHGQVSVAQNQTIYATYNSKEIVTLRYTDGEYQVPERIRFPLSDQSDVMMHPCISPDESCLIFCSGRSDGSYGKADLWVSFPHEDGSWSTPHNLGSNINTSASEGFPSLSFDGKYIFFDRNGDIYWVNTKIIKDLKPKNLR
jgi:Tol biopolymer transport system component